MEFTKELYRYYPEFIANLQKNTEWGEAYFDKAGNLVQKNTKTGEIKIITKKSTTDETEKESVFDYNVGVKNLKNQKIPVAPLNKDGSMAQAYRKKILDAGLDTAIIDWLWEAIIDGNSFEDIRQEIRNNNVDPAILDIFVQALQS